jgi:hypothetical protein
VALLPAVIGIKADAAPETTAIVFTVTVAPESEAIGVTETDAILFASGTVYDVVPDAKAGESMLLLSTKE